MRFKMSLKKPVASKGLAASLALERLLLEIGRDLQMEVLANVEQVKKIEMALKWLLERNKK